MAKNLLLDALLSNDHTSIDGAKQLRVKDLLKFTISNHLMQG